MSNGYTSFGRTQCLHLQGNRSTALGEPQIWQPALFIVLETDLWKAGAEAVDR
jgi:hypothetical protein